MPLNDNVHEHVSLNGLFVPFEKRLFGDNVNGLICDPYKSIMDAQTNRIDDSKLLPTVRTTDSVLWAGRDQFGRKASSKYAREEVESGLPAQDCRPNAASRRTMERKRKKAEISNICDGDKIFINLSAWPEYDDEWPYATPRAHTYVVGVYGRRVMRRRTQKRKLHVPAFEWNYEVDDEWIEEFGLIHELPIEGKLQY